MFVQGSTTNSAVLLGSGSVASGDCSVAEGYGSTAAGVRSHVEGGNTKASGGDSHAEGYYTTASGENSHAEGRFTVAYGNAAHAGGNNTIAKARSQTAIGEYNIQDDNNEFYLIVGNGTSKSARNNAFTVSKSGEVMAADGLRVKEDSSSDEVVMRYDSTNKCLKFIFE